MDIKPKLNALNLSIVVYPIEIVFPFIFSSFFFSIFFFIHYPLSRSRPSSSFYCFSRKKQTVVNRIHGPLFTRSPATLCLLLTNFGRSFLPFPSSLFLFHQSHQLLLSAGFLQLTSLSIFS